MQRLFTRPRGSLAKFTTTSMMGLSLLSVSFAVSAQEATALEDSTAQVNAEALAEQNTGESIEGDANQAVAVTQVARDPAMVQEIMRLLNEGNLGLSSSEISAIRDYYQAGNLLFEGNTAAIGALEDVLAKVDEHGLPADRYAFSAAGGNALEDKALTEIARAASLVRYSYDMERGLVDPRSVGPEIFFDPEGRSRLQILKDFAAAGSKPAFFADLVPIDPAYSVLQKELARLRAMQSEVGEAAADISAGATMRIGDQGVRVGELRNRLEYLGFPAVYEAPAQTSALEVATDNAQGSDDAIVEIAPVIAEVSSNSAEIDPLVFDEALDAAVKAFQEKAGISVDGVVGPATVSMLNLGPEDRIDSVLIALERHRWAPQDRSGRQIFVNIANFMAEVRDNNVTTFKTVVVVGQNRKDFRTPEFHDQMTHLIVNPKWNVPESISVKEYLPQIQRDPGVLSRQNIVMRIKGSGQIVDPSRIDMSQFTVNDFPFLLQQQEGDGNALGNVKFMFPNSHNIYLHDTPSKSLFKRDIRTFSHGCVRVEDPVGLAAHLLAPQYDDPRGTYQQFLASGQERQVNLATPIPIHLTYLTAYQNEAGTISYAPDSYGRDATLKGLLEEKGVIF